jgi:hypothetical protein
MENRSRWSAELIVAVLAVVIGVCTMFVYIYQARIMSKQTHAASWPYLEIIFSNAPKQFTILVKNKGAGPAIVKKAVVRLDQAIYADSQKNIDSVAFLLTGSRELLSGYTNVNSRVLSPEEEIAFIEVSDSASVELLLQSLRQHEVKLEICYCSVFDECWKAVDGKVESCEDCECN